MNVGMKFELLAPGMQHAEETNLCTEVSRITSNFEKSFGTGAEQEILNDLLVLQHQRGQPTRQCENHVQVARRKKFSLTRSDPALPSSGLALRAMAVTAAVVREGDTISAAGALVEMAAECGCTTPRNGPQHFDMLPTKPVAVAFDESLSRCADDIGHLQRWPAHLVLVGWLVVQCERIQRTYCCVQMALREMQIDGRLFQVLMTEQDLNSAEIGASF